MNDDMRAQCELMRDEELVRAITIEKDQFAPSFYDAVNYEMFKRGFALSDYVNKIRIRHSNGPEIETTWDAIESKIPEELSLWEAWFFTNSLEQQLYFQKEAMWTSVHFVAHEEGPESYFIQSDLLMKELVRKFVFLEDWRDGLENDVQLEAWRIVVESDSVDYIKLISGKLADHDIISTVKSQGYRNCACSGGGMYKILVPDEFEIEAKDLMAQLEFETDQLYREAENFTEASDPARELYVYQQLSVLAPDDPFVHYNLGIVLYYQGKYEEAADAFTESAFIDPMNIEMLENNLEYLQEIAQKLPDHLDILHTIAGLLNQKGVPVSEIASVYEKILLQDPMDELAHLNLGYLCYQDEDLESEAIKHFKQYLSLNPNAEDKDEIELIIQQCHTI